MSRLQKIVPCLWFADQGEEAVRFYRSLFPRSKLIHLQRWGADGMGPEGSFHFATIELAGQQLLVVNGNPKPSFTPAVSLAIRCRTQREIDRLWRKLSAGGRVFGCGWLEDRYRVTWQVLPVALEAMLRDPDPARVTRVMAALLPMKKLDVAKLARAYRSR